MADYRKFTTENWLYELTERVENLATSSLMEESEDDLRAVLEVTNCTVCTIPGRQLKDLFPPEKVAAYRNCHGKPLPGLYLRFNNVLKVWEETRVFEGADAAAQMDYLRFYLIPRYAAAIANHLFSIVLTQRHQLKEAAEVVRPMVEQMGTLQSTAAATSETPKDRFYALMDQMKGWKPDRCCSEGLLEGGVQSE